MISIIKARNSATMTEHHIPVSPHAIGKSITAATWNTSVREKDTIAEISPLLRAVKNDDVKMLKPINMKDTEKMRMPSVVISRRFAS